MVKVYNSEVIQELRNVAKIQGATDLIPTLLNNGIVPTLELNPKLVKNLRTAGNVAINATSSTIFSTPTDRDVYIVAVSLAYIQDVTATAVSHGVVATDELGVSRNLLFIPTLTLTVSNGTAQITLPHPLKLARGTNVTVTNSTNTGNTSAAGTIYYFIDETSNG